MNTRNFANAHITALFILVGLLTFMGQASANSICSDVSIPDQPQRPIWSRTIEKFRDTATLEVWRRPCEDGQADLFFTVTPDGSRFELCEVSFAAIQNGERFSFDLLDDPTTDRTFCRDIETRTTVFVHINRFQPFWDRLGEFRLEHDRDQILDVGAYGDEPGSTVDEILDFSGFPTPWFDELRRGDFSTAALPNNFTIPSVVPKGCMTVAPYKFNLPPSFPEFDETTVIEDIAGELVQIRMRAWRMLCHEPGRSAILLNLKKESDDIEPMLKLPSLSLKREGSSTTEPALASEFGALSIGSVESARARPLTNADMMVENVPFDIGRTFIVDLLARDMSVEDYNDSVVMRLDWGGNQVFEFDVSPPSFLDDEQLPRPALHGRYTGQWVAGSLPRSGLVLQIGEAAQDRNFVFAMWFTYLEGEPVWLTGNADIAIGESEVEMEMFSLRGGGFLTEPGSFSSDDVAVDSVGSMRLEALHCNKLSVELDFSSAGLGRQTLELSRLIRVAGFDCDQTQ